MRDSETILLLVEDDPDHQLLMKLAIESSDFEGSVRAVASAEMGLQYLLRRPPFEDPDEFPRPSLVILDLALPGMSGFDFLRAVRETPGLRTLPVLVVTVSDEVRDRKRALELGATAFCQKPSDFSLLLPLIKDLLEREHGLAAG